MDQYRSLLGFGSSAGSDQESCFPSLSFKERMIGFAVCFGLGTIINFFSFGSLMSILIGKPERFAITYTIGNVLSLLGTAFLIGFTNQLKSMSDPSRRMTSFVYIGSMVMTFVSAMVFRSSLLVLVFLIIQICAYIWYLASYFPLAQNMIKNCLRGTFNINL